MKNMFAPPIEVDDLQSMYGLRAPVYVRILREIMLPSVTHVFGERNFIFQDDNCHVHRARVVREFLDEQGVRTLPWPSKSPDLNPIQNIWGRMTSIMYKNEFRPNTVEQMVIDNNGAMTKY
jgi:hypothetical protein